MENACLAGSAGPLGSRGRGASSLASCWGRRVEGEEGFQAVGHVT